MLVFIFLLLPLPVEAYQTKWASEKLMVIHEIKTQALEYGVDEKTALRIADCESDFNPRAKNKNSSAYGVYQFLDKTWKYTGGGDRNDYKLQITRFMELYPKYPLWWECR